MTRYLLTLLAASSQWLNALLAGNRDQSLSSRSYEAWSKGLLFGRTALPAIDTLFWFQPNHCATAFLSDDERTYT